MNKYLAKIKEIFDPKYYDVFSVYDADDRYLFGIRNKKYSGEPLDPYYTIDKKTLKIRGFLPHMEKDVFRNAINHPVDWRL